MAPVRSQLHKQINHPPDMNDDTEDHHHEAPPPVIQPIAPSAVQRIVAGQAVIDLSSAVKELVDNAIDAGAKRVCGEWKKEANTRISSL